MCIVVWVWCDTHYPSPTSAFIPSLYGHLLFVFLSFASFLTFYILFFSLFFLFWFLCNEFPFVPLRSRLLSFPAPSLHPSLCNPHVLILMPSHYVKAPWFATWDDLGLSLLCARLYFNTHQIETGFYAIKRTAQVQSFFLLFSFKYCNVVIFIHFIIIYYCRLIRHSLPSFLSFSLSCDYTFTFPNLF